MCCRRGPRRQPLAITLGQYAYRKYQQNKQDRALPEPNTLQRRASPPPEVLERNANDEILEKAGMMPPPSYDAVVNQTIESHGEKVKRVASHSSASEDESGLSDAESFFELDAQGTRRESAVMGEAQREFVGGWRENREIAGAEEMPVLTKWQQKRADKAMRKAEKAARKADRAAMGW